MARDFSREFYKSKAWQDTRKYIIKRDKYLCRRCSQPGTEVHHIIHLTPENMDDVTVTLNPDNLELLCRECHFMEHYKDKAEGHKQKSDNTEAINEYEFDSNGYVISPHKNNNN